MSRRPSHLSNDPVVEEIRAVRAAIWRKAGQTGKGLMRLLRESEVPAESAAPSANRSKRSIINKTRRAAAPRPPQSKG